MPTPDEIQPAGATAVAASGRVTAPGSAESRRRGRNSATPAWSSWPGEGDDDAFAALVARYERKP